MLHLKSEEFVGTKSSIKVLNRDPQFDYPEHCHDFSELILVSAGSGVHIVNGLQKVVLPNTLACVSDNDYHQYVDNRDVTLVNILYNKHQLNLSPKAVNVIKHLEDGATNLLITEDSFEPILAIADNMRIEQQREYKHSEVMVSLMFEQLLLTIDRLNMTQIDNSPLMNAIVFLINNYREQDLSVQQICDSFQVSSRALSNKISQLTGSSTNKFLNQLRIRKAMTLIETGLSITDVAYRVGYNDSNYFSTKFKCITGQSPSAYKSHTL
ncbi:MULTISPECIES: helix-turn-helix domain-containing protein [unclassified Agarivorans]|uniref:helix-turn-helix domain-containing protein n=1 Tax=unclassified Agarivorans TaxID=2636026 RepID=UPI003D7C48DC